ncbi:MAG TPA: NADH-quinone oxidoreductase subunit H [Terriglobales bacterium]|nr:NADH-quinone oxidoreductase subunit H [Terriglobales bacterium]
MTLVNILQAVLLVLIAPLLRGVIAGVKARIQNRRGASVFRPYSDLLKLLRKEDLVPDTASALFRVAPVVLFAVTVVCAAFVPVVHGSALLGTTGDFILLVYLFALGRFFLVLGAMDGGSSFGGMGASREALVSTLAEAPLLLGLAAVAIQARSASLASMVQWTLHLEFFQVSAVHALAFAALALVAIAETGRIPVDNPTTHLELTMIHEAMVLEYSGPSLALIEWASAIKLSVIAGLLIALFLPPGMATALTASALAMALLAFLLKLLLLAVVVAVVESSVAKLRMYMVPDFLGVASALAILAVVFTALMR